MFYKKEAVGNTPFAIGISAADKHAVKAQRQTSYICRERCIGDVGRSKNGNIYAVSKTRVGIKKILYPVYVWLRPAYCAPTAAYDYDDNLLHS